MDALIDWLPANGIGNIKRNGPKLIELARDRAGERGCVAVIVDGDGRDPARDDPHRAIDQACRAGQVPLVIAREAMEAWFLADEAVCVWLGVRVEPNTATIADPKRVVADTYLRTTGRTYRRLRRARLIVAQKASDPNAGRNSSLAEALAHLAACGVASRRRRLGREAPRGRIPAFRSIAEEAEFWDTHDSAEFEDEFETVTDVTFVRAKRKRGLTVRLEPETLAALSRAAREQGIGPSTLARMWIVQRLKQLQGRRSEPSSLPGT